jgi:short-subunit dehydrogenase
VADHWIQADLSNSEQRIVAVDRLLDEVGFPDLVVLNAGLGHWAPAGETNRRDADRVMELNYWAPVELTRHLLDRAQERALHVVVISSIAAKFGQKKLATYSASKAALAIWAESVNEEWQGSAHRIQLILPGVVSTNIMRHSLGRDGQALGDRAANHQGWSIERTARAIERATNQRGFVHILANKNVRFALILHDLCPRMFYFLLRRRP